MSSTYLILVNRILKAFNEVNLTSSTFASATGFHADAKDSINQAILDIYTFEDTEWPFAWNSTTFNTVTGTFEYNYDTAFSKLDWDSFRITRQNATASVLSQVSGTATFVASAAHNFLTGDSVTITGATPDGYNATATITVTNSTTFTYSVSSSLSASASGTITAKSNSVGEKRLKFKDLESYRKEDYAEDDANSNVTGYARPDYVVRKQDNNFIISPVSDRVYTIKYEGFYLPSSLVTYSETSSIPTPFDQVIVDKALHYAYMFRDNLEEAALVHSRYEDNVRKMRRILIPQWEYLRYTF